jgi:hypothetical protein
MASPGGKTTFGPACETQNEHPILETGAEQRYLYVDDRIDRRVGFGRCQKREDVGLECESDHGTKLEFSKRHTACASGSRSGSQGALESSAKPS